MARRASALLVIAWVGIVQPSYAQQDLTTNENQRFAALFSEGDGGQGSSPKLELTFFSVHPKPTQAEEILHNCLQAAAAMRPGSDITGEVWYSVSPSETDRQPVAMVDGSNILLYSSKDNLVRYSKTDANIQSPKADKTDDGELAYILADRDVKPACNGVADDRMAAFVAVAVENQKKERKHIVKALRTWCKENDVAIDRDLRACLSSISKAVKATGESNALNPEELAAAIARGQDDFNNAGQCAKCHQADGSGGPRAPDLTDSTWLHCDGSIEGIRKVLLAGVPENKLKDSSRPFGMNPTTDLIPDKKQIADLAIYVRSLSQE